MINQSVINGDPTALRDKPSRLEERYFCDNLRKIDKRLLMLDCVVGFNCVKSGRGKHTHMHQYPSFERYHCMLDYMVLVTTTTNYPEKLLYYDCITFWQ